MTCLSLDESHKASCTQNHNAILFNGVLLEKMFPAICTSMTSRLTFIIVSCQSWLSLGISPYAQIDFMCDAQTRLMKGSLLIICVYWQYSSSSLHQSFRLHLNQVQVLHLWLENKTHIRFQCTGSCLYFNLFFYLNIQIVPGNLKQVAQHCFIESWQLIHFRILWWILNLLACYLELWTKLLNTVLEA